MNRQRWTWFAAAVASAAVGTMAACTGDDNVVGPTSDGGTIHDGTAPTDSPIGQNDSGGTVPTGTADIQLINVSDWHGQIDPVGDRDTNGVTQLYGGAGVLLSYLKKERAANPNTIFVTQGDVFSATPALSAFNEDKPAVDVMNLLGLQLDTLGNHNFDHNLDHPDAGPNGTFLLQRMDQAKYPFVSTNLDHQEQFFTNTNKPTKGYYMMTVGTTDPKPKIAFVGITNPDAPAISFPGALGPLVIKEPIAAAEKAATEARAAGASVVIALTHMGVTGKDANGQVTGALIDFAKGLTQVDVVFGDHTDAIANTTVGSVLVTENKSKGRTYGRTKISIKDGKLTSKVAEIVDPIGLYTAFLGNTCGDGGVGPCTCPTTACPDATYTCTAGKCQVQKMPVDPAVDALLLPYKDSLAKQFDGKIGQIAQLFPRDGQIERKQEVEIGDLLADALLDHYKAPPFKAQIVFSNGGGIRAPLPSSYVPKDLTLVRPPAAAPWDLVIGDIYTVLPFGNQCVVRKITGKLLWEVLEFAVAKEPSFDGRFLQIAGFKYVYKVSNAPGARVQSVTLLDGSGDGGVGKDIPVTDTTEYTMVTNNFTNAGGDGYIMLQEAVQSAPLEVMADIVKAYVQNLAKSGPITAPADFGTRVVQIP